MQDIEFTIEKGKLYMLQTRNGKRTDRGREGRRGHGRGEADHQGRGRRPRVEPQQLDQLFAPVFDPKAEKAGRKAGIWPRACPPAPAARAARSSSTPTTAEEWAKQGKKVILVRIETSPEDIGGMDVAKGILTARGGMTSHAAVVARGMGKPLRRRRGRPADRLQRQDASPSATRSSDEGDWISLNGFTGTVYVGQIKVQPSEIIQVQDGSSSRTACSSSSSTSS